MRANTREVSEKCARARDSIVTARDTFPQPMRIHSSESCNASWESAATFIENGARSTHSRSWKRMEAA